MEHRDQKKVRIDKWLWAIRLFKTRNQATLCCKAGKVKKDGQSLKQSYLVNEGDVYVIRKGQINYTIKVVEVFDKRMSASLVADKYEDLTPEEEKNKQKMRSAFHAPTFFREKGSGRPTKKDRRNIDRLSDQDP